MTRNSGSTRAKNSRTASESRTTKTTATSAAQTSKWDANYINSKAKEINSFKLPRQNDFEYINIKGENYRVRHQKTYDGRHIIDIIRRSNGSSMGRDVYTNSGSYGYAITRTKGEVAKGIRNELLNILKRD